MDLSNFLYREGMTVEEMECVMEELTAVMATGEYWLEYGGDATNYDPQGNSLIVEYLNETDRLGIPRNQTMIVAWNKQLRKNLARRYILNRTTTHVLKVLMMSGREILVPFDSITSLGDVMEHISDEISVDYDCVNLYEQTRELSWHTRLIVTDDTVITLVVQEPEDNGPECSGPETEYEGGEDSSDDE